MLKRLLMVNAPFGLNAQLLYVFFLFRRILTHKNKKNVIDLRFGFWLHSKNMEREWNEMDGTSEEIR